MSLVAPIPQPVVTSMSASLPVPARPLRIRWLGRVAYNEALALQRGIFEKSTSDYLLLLEHPHVFTMGVRASDANVLRPAEGVDVVRTNRGGDVTYHGPGQLVGYPIVDVAGAAGLGDTARYVAALEQLLIDVLADLGMSDADRMAGHPGVWLGAETPQARKIAAVGVRISRGRTMHGFALNVEPDLSWFDRIVPCGIADKAVTSLGAEGLRVTMQQVVDAVVGRAPTLVDRARTSVHSPSVFSGDQPIERQDVVWRIASSDLSAFTRGEGPGETPVPAAGTLRPTRGRTQAGVSPASATKARRGAQPVRLLGRLAAAGVDSSDSVAVNARKPEWMRVKADFGPEYTRLKKTVRDLGLVTVCEEAGCPNIFDCWNDGTATFMIAGDRCTRACGFCLVDTRKPLPLDPEEPDRVAAAIEKMGLDHAVITMTARDDLADGGASAVAATIDAVHRRCPGTAVEVLISDCKGDDSSLQTIFAARPEVLNHNLETVARLQRAVRPSAGYARSLSVLARAVAAGLVAKSGLIVGMGETENEVLSALADLRSVGTSIVTIGQYLRPTTNHLPVDRWWTPEEFDQLRLAGEQMGFAHVESSPLTRSSYHAKQGARAAQP